MRVSDDKKFLEFNLKNGWRYQEKGNRLTTNTEYIRLGFKEYKKILDLSSFEMNKTSDTAFQDHYKMLSIRQLGKSIDSMKKTDVYYQRKNEAEITPYFSFAKYADSTWPPVDKKNLKAVKSFDEILPDSAESFVLDRVASQLASVRSTAELMVEDYKGKLKERRSYTAEWHRKLTLAFACVVLFLIGAPLGSIIRKGGLGTPLVFAVIFFVIFHLLNTFGEKFVKEAVMPPVLGMWLSAIVLIPVGVFLTFKAMRDSQLFNQEFYYRTFKKLRIFASTFKKAKVRTA
jgi:lipopolysaccharide export system permease protein